MTGRKEAVHRDCPEMQFHPAATIFPLMDEQQFAELKADIEANGQREDIVLYNGKILDGRNRYLACLELGFKPERCELDDCTDAIAYVLSMTLHRRQHQRSCRRCRTCGRPRHELSLVPKSRANVPARRKAARAATE